MKKILLTALVVVVALGIVLAVVIAMQSEDFTVTRSNQISASPAEVHAHINDFHKWDAWSPWAKIDPAMRTSITGPPSGIGAKYAWEGNSEVGKGNMTITDSRPGENVKIDLQFTEPFEATNVTEFKLQPAGEGTNVTWTISGKKNFLMKAMCLVVDMDQMMGPDFEKGLSQLKQAAENR